MIDSIEGAIFPFGGYRLGHLHSIVGAPPPAAFEASRSIGPPRLLLLLLGAGRWSNWVPMQRSRRSRQQLPPVPGPTLTAGVDLTGCQCNRSTQSAQPQYSDAPGTYSTRRLDRSDVPNPPYPAYSYS